MGQTEAPLTIRPFLPKLTKSELMTVMTSGMAHISGGMMAAYIRVGGADAKSLLTAVIMTAPGTLLMAKMLVPETEQPLTAGRVEMPAAETRLERAGGDCARHHRWIASGAQRWRDADRVSGAAGVRERVHGLDPPAYRMVSVQHAAGARLGFFAGGVADRDSVARCGGDREFAGDAHGAE